MQTPAQQVPEEDYRKCLQLFPRLCVDLIVKTEQGILMTLRNIPPYQGLWHLPGGGVKFKETIDEAATRISKREFGVEVKLGRLLGVNQILDDDIAPNDRRHSIVVVYEAVMVAGVPVTTSESKEIGYFKAMPEGVHPHHESFLREHKIF